MPITLPFLTWKYSDAEKVVPKLGETEKSSAKFYGGDHWQDSLGWLGPNPQSAGPGGEGVLVEIQKAFVSRNVVKEVVDRHMRGVIGREPGWTLTLLRPDVETVEPSEQELAALDEADNILTQWWNNRRAHAQFQTAVAQLLYTQRAYLHLFVPKGLLDEAPGGAGTLVRAADLLDSLRFIHLGQPDPEAATVNVDPLTGYAAGVVLTELEVEGQKTKFAEVSYQSELDPLQTIVRVLEGDTATDYTLPLGGRALVFEMQRPLMVTPQVLQAQRALNLSLSMLPRNVVTGGFLERVILNGLMPGKWEGEGESKKFIPDPMIFGAGIVNWIQGIEWEEKDGTTKVAHPEVAWRDPVPVDTPIEAKREHYRDILDEVDQAHVLMNADANASGLSREQARADYQASLDRTRAEVEAAGRWCCETVLALAELFGGRPGQFTTVMRVDFVCHVDAGPISVEERKQNMEEAKGGFLSQVTAMSRNGVDDPEAELNAIAGQPDAELALLQSQAEVIEILTRSGMTLAGAAELAGMDPEQLTIVKRETDEAEGDDDTDPGDVVPPEDQ